MIKIRNNETGLANYLIILFILALVITVISFAWFNAKNNDVSNTEKQTTSTEQTNTQNTENSQSTEKQPTVRQVVYVNETDFSLIEKEKLTKYLVNPYYDYSEMFKNSSDYNPITSFKINRYSDSELNSKTYAKYRYGVEVEKKIGKNEFLFGDNDLIDWWIPICEYICNVNEEFKNKYPEIISTMVKQGIRL